MIFAFPLVSVLLRAMFGCILVPTTSLRSTTIISPLYYHEMHALYSICILSLADFVHGAAFNPLYHQNHDIASQPVKFSSIPMDKIHEARDGSQGTRRYSKQAHWFPSDSTNRLVYRRIPDPVSKSPTLVQPRDDRPTPAPTGDPSLNTTVHIADAKNFALIAPQNPQRMMFYSPTES
jgi:hypothetical protein